MFSIFWRSFILKHFWAFFRLCSVFAVCSIIHIDKVRVPNITQTVGQTPRKPNTKENNSFGSGRKMFILVFFCFFWRQDSLQFSFNKLTNNQKTLVFFCRFAVSQIRMLSRTKSIGLNHWCLVLHETQNKKLKENQLVFSGFAAPCHCSYLSDFWSHRRGIIAPISITTFQPTWDLAIWRGRVGFKRILLFKGIVRFNTKWVWWNRLIKRNELYLKRRVRLKESEFA